ncbi:CHAP domain-containing protein [Sulfurovum sp. zt1-1]|uniref:CHAP domain-containing protein n=1 Tax=Sulfurovum zhangzhouensis TaxID=3019067 RepID=A0ABT7QYC0_9BACT|nr:CHAP domain-containing protein [Sulfurovum zhangzhouensis]MDM5271834.1 CHAP domain-containing protein [Sulfurovum zhangzhouensis]
MRRQYFTVPFLLFILLFEIYYFMTNTNLNTSMEVGTVIDKFNGVNVYFNGGVNHSSGRNLSPDGYNLGIKYQCVEFVKRYYYQRFNHKMPDSMGHAKHFFDPSLKDGQLNKQRNLLQFTNGSKSKPVTEDLIIFSPTLLNPYGHVAIISNVFNESIQIVQQNAGPFSSTRAFYRLKKIDNLWYVEGRPVLGWLRVDSNTSNTIFKDTQALNRLYHLDGNAE